MQLIRAKNKNSGAEQIFDFKSWENLRRLNDIEWEFVGLEPAPKNLTRAIQSTPAPPKPKCSSCGRK